MTASDELVGDLLDRARQLREPMIDAVQALVTCESPTDDVAACTAITQESVGILSGWLPTPARVEYREGRPVWRWGPERPRVLLLGHLDTVWPIGTLARLPFTIDDDRITGPGVFDMKAGIVQGWAALALLGVSDDDGIGMLLTTDEETGSLASRAVIADAIRDARAVLVLEASAEGALKTARKGTSWYTIDVVGRAAHAGLDPERGVNAVGAAAELVIATRGWAHRAAGTSVTPTTLRGGTTTNTVPADARLTLDVRAWSRTEQERVDGLVRGWRPQDAECAINIGGGIDRPAMEASASRELFAVAQQVAARVGLPPLTDCAVGGASDGNLTAAAGVPTLDGLGAVGDGAHADHEWASITGMVERAALLAGLLAELS